MEPAGELSKLLVRGVELAEGSLEVLLGLAGVGSQRACGEMHRVRDADKVLLCPVVKVALEALSLGVARQDDARARAADLLLDRLARGHVETAEEVSGVSGGVLDDRRRPVHHEARAVGRIVLVLDDAGRVTAEQACEVELGARDVLLRDESRPEGRPDPLLLGDPGRPAESLVDAEERPLPVDEREEARRRADDRATEVTLAFEFARLPGEVGEVADDEDELVVPGGDDASLVLVLLAPEVERVLDLLKARLGDRLPPGLEHEVGDLRGQPGVHAVPDDLVRRGREILLGVDLEAPVDPVDPDPEDRVGDRGDERPGLEVGRRRLVEPRVDGRRCHCFLLPRSRLRPACLARSCELQVSD